MTKVSIFGSAVVTINYGDYQITKTNTITPVLHLFCFFFQAEDGIRGLYVTGVQTCALPIYPWIEALEQGIVDGRAVCNAITGWENRWAMRNLVDQHPAGVSARAKATLEKAEAMTPEDYRAALMERTTAQLRHAALAQLADAIVTLSCPGPASL